MGHFYRVDKFRVPNHGRVEFLEAVRKTHVLLREQTGFIRDYIMEEVTEDDASTIITFVEWTGAEAIADAKKSVQALHRDEGFEPRDLFERLGIRAEVGTYRPV
jgi:heme-degrading monooxygenase HmoA